MSTTTTRTDAPSDRAVAFFNTLATERGLDLYREGMTRREVSQGIDRMKAMPRTPRPQGHQQVERPATQPQVADGRYALTRTDAIAALPGDSDTVFIKVNTSTSPGRWNGFTFVDFESSEDRIPVKNGALKSAVLAAIAASPLEASMLYGREIGRCGVCHIKLTDDDSRAMGIGPDCFKAMTGRNRVKADVAPYLEAQPVRQTIADMADMPLSICPDGSPYYGEDAEEFTMDDSDSASADKAGRMAARMVTALENGTEAWKIRDGIREDATLTDEHKSGLLAALDALVAQQPTPATPAEERSDKARAAAIKAAYAAGDTEKGKALEAEDTGFSARRRAEFGF